MKIKVDYNDVKDILKVTEGDAVYHLQGEDVYLFAIENELHIASKEVRVDCEELDDTWFYADGVREMEKEEYLNQISFQDVAAYLNEQNEIGL